MANWLVCREPLLPELKLCFPSHSNPPCNSIKFKGCIAKQQMIVGHFIYTFCIQNYAEFKNRNSKFCTLTSIKFEQKMSTVCVCTCTSIVVLYFAEYSLTDCMKNIITVIHICSDMYYNDLSS